MAKRFELMTRGRGAIKLVPEQKDLKWRTKKHQRLKKRSNEDMIETRRYLWSNFNANVWTRMTPRLFHSKTLSLRQHSFSFSFSWMNEWVFFLFRSTAIVHLEIFRFIRARAEKIFNDKSFAYSCSELPCNWRPAETRNRNRKDKTERNKSNVGRHWIWMKGKNGLWTWNNRWAVVVVQLVERLLPTLEIRGLNPDIGKILSTNCTIEKTKINKRGREWPILKKNLKQSVLVGVWGGEVPPW